MRRYKISELNVSGAGHILTSLVPGRYLNSGGLSFTKPGHRTHDTPEPHRHADSEEVFIILQGRGVIQIDGTEHPVSTGDVLVVEPNEDHHLVSDRSDPIVHIWLHASDTRHPNQQPADH